MPFSKLGLTPSLCTPLAKMGYTQPTPVQSASIPIILSGSDLLARAQTGTGKTAAFALPMIERLLAHRPRQANSRAPRGLVLVPTRPQREALRRGIDIVVATPGRLIDHLQQGSIDLSRIEILTLDESDRML